MPSPRRVAITITAQCLCISQLYLYLGGSSRGRTQFRQLMNYVVPTENDDIKAGALVLVVFAIPLLVAGAACALLLTADPCGGDVGSTQTGDFRQVQDDSEMETSALERSQHCNLLSIKCKRHRRTACKPIHRTILDSPALFSIAFVLIPCLVFYFSNIVRHYQSAVGDYPTFPNLNEADLEQHFNDIDIREQISNWRRKMLQHIANDSAILALVAMAHLLVPISKHSPLVLLSRWSPVEAVVIHKWAGRLGIFGVVMHGSLHLIIAYWRWWNTFVRNDTLSHQETYSWIKRSFWHGYLPQWSCWRSVFFGSSFDESDNDSVDDSLGYACYHEKCTCYDFFLNLTGVIGMVALIVLGVASVGYVRRHHYRSFYLIHITAGPCFIIMATLHYNRTILYLCPSILYYASTTVPTYIQNWMERRCSDRGTRILSVTKISCPTLQRPNAAVWDIVFEASYKAVQQYRPGQSGYLHVPQISIVKHPFTVNKIPGCHDRLRLLIRETGTFTFQLGSCLNYSLERRNSTQLLTEQDMEAQQLPYAVIPPMHITGFHGSYYRMQQLYSHDKVIIIAGGIGITPYLSLLLDVVHQQTSLTSSKDLKSLELHWICRDVSLVHYVEEHYFSEMLKYSRPYDEKPTFSLDIIVHHTGTHLSPSTNNTITICPESSSQYCAVTSPMIPCYFSLGINQHVSQNKFSFVVFTSIFSAGLWLVWLLFERVQSKDAMATRILPLFFISVLSIGLAIFFVDFSGENRICCKIPMSSSTEVDNYSTVTENDQTSSPQALVSYEEHSTGRPDLHNILLPLKDSRNPCVFVCGPKHLMESVRHAAKSCCSDCMIYEEFFEI